VLRRRIAEAFEPAARARGLTTDISVDTADIHHGDDWYRFLASCKYFLGAEGGATVLDPNGEFMHRTQRYLDEHPDATFEEVEAACFPGEDGKLQLFAISPRHLEACATRTCQVLVEGEYSGVLRAGEHYIEVKRDLSNVEEALDLIQSDSERERITEAAYRDVVASGLYTYRHLVESIETEGGIAAAAAREPLGRGLRFRHRLAELMDRLSWAKVAVYVRGARALRWIGTRVLPQRLTARVRDRLAGADPAPPTEQPATGDHALIDD
jgi:Glycosyl transferases group 1